MKRARKIAVEQQVADAADGPIAAWAELDTLRTTRCAMPYLPGIIARYGATLTAGVWLGWLL